MTYADYIWYTHTYIYIIYISFQKLVMLFEDTWVRSFKSVSVLGVAILYWVSVGRLPFYRVSRFEM